MKSLALALGAVALAVGLTGVGVLLGSARATDPERIARLEAESDARRDQADRLRVERDRLRAERNQLEARLAAGGRRPTCPAAYLSSRDSALVPWFHFDYPCAWHVLYDARAASGAEEDRPGLRAEVVLLSRLPLSLSPRAGPLADIEIVDWTDDPADDADRLPPLERWLSDERARFAEPPAEQGFVADDGITIHLLRGPQDLAGERVGVSVLLWEYEDGVSGLRHVGRAFAQSAPPAVRAALERVARSFTVARR